MKDQRISNKLRKIWRRFTGKNETAALNSASPTTPKFSLQTDGNKVSCKVVNVVDGDTLDIAIIINKLPQVIRIRLVGIDAPEQKPRLVVPDRDRVIGSAIAARDYLQKLVYGKICYAIIYKQDNFGRWLCGLYLKKHHDISVNILMIQTNNAVPYIRKGPTTQI